MASKTTIYNSALVKLGASTVVSPDDGSNNATVLNAIYDQTLDSLLRDHLWNFAIERVQLAESATEPVFGFDNKFALPSDCLRIVSVHDNDAGLGGIDYRLEGAFIHADSTEVYLRYVKQVTDPNAMTVSFREALAWRLAREACMAITQSTTLLQAMAEGARAQTIKAQSTDALEDFPDETPSSSWVMERY